MACDICLGQNTKKCPVCGTRKEPIECPFCHGTGIYDCIAYFVDSEEIEEVHPEDYLLLPHSEDEARLWGVDKYQGDSCTCRECCGSSKVYEEDGEYYPAEY